MTYETGHIYIKFSNHYTATVRNIEDFKSLLADPTEDKSILEIVEVSNVTPEFEKAIKCLIDQYKNPKKIAKQYIKIYNETQQLETEKFRAQENCYAVYELEHCKSPTQKKYLKKLATKQQSKVDRIKKKLKTRYTKLEKIEDNISSIVKILIDRAGIQI